MLSPELGADMRRREFITLLGGAAAWPLVADAQQQPMPVIGFLNGASPGKYAPYVTGFLQGLEETGYIEGQSVAIEYRWAEGQYNRLPGMAADLVRRQVAVIAANTPATAAAKGATTKIPIVFVSGDDPVANGLVTSLNRPGGNVTGVSLISSALGAKQLGLLHELVPSVASIAVLVNPANPTAKPNIRDAEEAARSLGQQIHILNAGTETEIDTAFATLAHVRAGALVVGPDSFLISRTDQIVTLAARHAVPTMYPFRDFTEAGGLLSYGAILSNQYRQAGVYTGKIIKGAKPADLPVMQPTKFELVINLQTAKSQEIEIPPALLARADDVIE
jgi:putative tryptophan/tyrosine transport system substrate-binding protein